MISRRRWWHIVSVIIIIVLVSGFLVSGIVQKIFGPQAPQEEIEGVTAATIQIETLPDNSATNPEENVLSAEEKRTALSIIATNLVIPWDIVFLPSGDLFVTQRPGTLLRIGKDQISYPIEGVLHKGEGGLLGIALHPDFTQNNYIYLYLTTTSQNQVINRVERYTLEKNTLSEKKEILSNIPGARYHDGGQIAFGPDNYLYITTGDAGIPQLAQDTSSLAGKILRIKDDGSIPDDNPFDNAVYSYGHRNPQGLSWDEKGNLWSTEHGPSGMSSGEDEVNLIEKEKNYGWPLITGDETENGLTPPVIQSGKDYTWAPASAAWYKGSLFFGGLRGSSLYQYNIETKELKAHFFNDFGRIRAVVLGPDNYLYMSTSNRDGRGRVRIEDDKIIRIDMSMIK